MSWIRRNPALAMLLIIVISVAVRIITAEYIDIGGDNTQRWSSAKELLLNGSITQWTHHNMRWSIVLPMWGAMKLFGTNPVVYYIPTIAAATLGSVFIFLIGRRVHSAEFGFMAAMLAIIFPQMVQTGSQNWPSVYQFAYAALSIWAIMEWHEKPRTWLLALAAAGFMLCWGARATALFYFPGLVFLLWLPGRQYKAVFLFCCFVGLFMAGEWLFFYLDSGNIFGRIGIVKSSARPVEASTLTDYLLNAFNLKRLKGLMPIYILCVAAGVWQFCSTDLRRKGLAGLYLLFIFFFSYMVSSFDPIRTAVSLSSRIWCTVAPIGLLLLLLSLYDLAQSRPRLGQGIMVILFCVFIVFSAKRIPASNALAQVSEDYTVLNPVIDANAPLELHWIPWRPNWIESIAFSIAGIKKEKKIDPHSVRVSMERGTKRALGIHGSTPHLWREFENGKLVRQSDLVYIYYPAGTPETTPPGATITFDRKGAQAQPIAN